MEKNSNSSSMDDLDRAPESWEVADLDESMRRLKLAISSKNNDSSRSQSSSSYSAPNDGLLGASAGSIERSSSDVSVNEEMINQVDQFLREALNNPRERLSVLRMEQDVEKFIRDPTQQQLEFQQLPTSYLRLAAHRVAQHYSLQSMVLLDNTMPDGSGSRIIVTKMSDCQLPLIRLADIPVNLPPEETGGAVKVAIKQRAQRRSQVSNTGNSQSSKTSGPKSVEERKEDYNRARARIFSSGGSTSSGASGKPEIDTRIQDTCQYGSFAVSKAEDKYVSGGSDVNIGRGSFDSSSGSSRTARARVEKEPVISRHKPKVAIFRDREVERNDPDYDRNYDRYLQRFDPGFGFNGGPYTMQPMYTPAVNYNTEFPQLGAVHRPQISTEHQPRAHPQHLPGGPGQWIASSNHAGISYGHPETMMTQFNPNHGGMRSTSAIYLHSSQFPCQHPGMTYIHPREHVQPFSPSHQQQPDASYGLARPR